MSGFISRVADGLIGRFENWRARERAFRELSSLDDRSLSDIGLTRADIPFVLDRKFAEATPARPEPVVSNSNVRHAA